MSTPSEEAELIAFALRTIIRQPTRRVNPAPCRLADLLAALSMETDLAMGHPAEEAMRVCLLATGLARCVGVREEIVRSVYETSLLMHVGCTAFAHEQAAFFGGDEIAVNDAGSATDTEVPREMLAMLLKIGRGMGPIERTRLFYAAATRGVRFGRAIASANCEVATATAERLGLSDGVQEALDHLFERWDGKGAPRGLAGDAIALPARFAQLAAQATVFARLGGPGAALEVVRQRSGASLDPDLADWFGKVGAELLGQITDPWCQVLDAEPRPHQVISHTRVDTVARAFADVVDLKSVYTLGHSHRVSTLAEAAGREAGLSSDDRVGLRRAGWLHDLGKAGIPNGIWEKPGTLTAAEWEQVRLHPYHSERILARSEAFSSLARLAGAHHEKIDGSGYYRGSRGGSLSMPDCLLAAADTFVGRTEERSYRPAYAPQDVADHLHAEAKAGRLDAEAVEAVLAAAGHERSVVRTTWPGDLTDREVEVLRLLARGLTNREIGRRLHISPKTAGRHVEHIYGKLEVSSRPAAALFAVRHDLIRDSA